jgi:translation initiation factor 1
VARQREAKLVYSTGGVPQPASRESAAGPPAAQRRGGVRLRLERRASGRVATLVSGLPGTAAEIAALARELKAACGAGGAFKDGVLELQGDHRKRVQAALAARGLGSERAGG